MSSHANDDNEIIKSYLKELSKDKFSPIPYPIEKSLLENIKKGDKKAEAQLIEAHVRLVCNIAKKYKGRGVEMTDLIQEGNLGLYEALNKFDSTKGVRFCVYAECWIRNYIGKAILNKANTHSNEINMTSILHASQEKKDTRENEDLIGKNSLLFDDEEVNQEEQYCDMVQTLMNGLDDRMRFVIEYCYGINGKEQLTMVEIAKRLNLTPERVRQIKVRAMMTLRSNALINSMSMHNVE